MIFGEFLQGMESPFTHDPDTTDAYRFTALVSLRTAYSLKRTFGPHEAVANFAKALSGK